jgi:hypothetical protein
MVGKSWLRDDEGAGENVAQEDGTLRGGVKANVNYPASRGIKYRKVVPTAANPFTIPFRQ